MLQKTRDSDFVFTTCKVARRSCVFFMLSPIKLRRNESSLSIQQLIGWSRMTLTVHYVVQFEYHCPCPMQNPSFKHGYHASEVSKCSFINLIRLNMRNRNQIFIPINFPSLQHRSGLLFTVLCPHPSHSKSIITIPQLSSTQHISCIAIFQFFL